MKIVIIGAGSECFGRGQVADILQAAALRGRDVQMVLVDVDESALETMTRVAERIKAHTGTDVRIESTTDRALALPGADYVITAVARKRYALWEQDFRVPLSYGFRHCLGENGGPGALFHALRSFELVIPICRDIEQYCPDALLLNFTNPEARVLHAILHLTKVRALGICHGVFWALDLIAKYLQQPIENFDIRSAGINHFYTVLQVTEKATGKDCLPELIQQAARETNPHLQLFRSMAEVFEVFTFPSDDHIGEYLSFGAEYHGIKWPYGREVQRQHRHESAPGRSLAEYAAGRRPIDAQVLAPSGEVTVPIILDMVLNRGTLRPAVNVLNRDGYISNLPLDAAIEIPAIVDAGGVHPLHVGAIPEPYAAYMRTQCNIIALVTEAYRTRSKKVLLQALLLDPNVNSIEGASRLLDDMLNLQQDFLPDFSPDIAQV